MLAVLAVLTPPTAWSAPQMKWSSLMLMQAAAEKGDPAAQYLIGLQYQAGDGIDRDPAAAAQWFRKSAETGNADAQNALGSLYVSGTGVTSDQVEALKWFRASATQGNADAQLNLGLLYGTGGVAGASPGEAMQWYLLSAQAGNLAAMLKLGEAYARGLGVPPDPDTALKWYRRAADAGNVEATFILQRREAILVSAARDLEPTLRTWMPEADKGDMGAWLALQVLRPGPIKPDEPAGETVRWSLLLSGLRGADAYVVRGYVLENGIGMARDDAAAADYYRRAAGQGSMPGQFRLGQLYAAGRGVPRNLAEAHFWLRLASSRNSEEATAALAALLPRLDQEELAAAERLWQERTALVEKK